MTARRARAVFLAGVAALSLLLASCGLEVLLPTATPSVPPATPTPWTLDDSALFSALAAGMEAGAASIDLKSFAIPREDQDEVYRVFTEVIATTPGAYRCRGSLEYDLTSVDDGKTWTIQAVRPSYQPQDVLAEADRWIAGLSLASKTPFERVRLLHDRVVRSTRYDTDAAAANDATLPAFSAAGVLFHGKAVCQGYAEALTVLLNRAGVPTVLATGTARGIAHAWVVVRLGDAWHHVDATFDDPVPDAPGRTSYQYFLLTDAELAEDHVRDLAEPACADGSYAWMHGMQDVVRDAGGRYLYSDAAADGAATVVGADGTGAARIPFKVYGKTHKTTRGYYLCLAPDGALYLSNYSDGATIYRMGPGESVLVPFRPDGHPDGIFPAKNLRIEGTLLRYDLMDDEGDVTASGSVPVG